MHHPIVSKDCKLSVRLAIYGTFTHSSPDIYIYLHFDTGEIHNSLNAYKSHDAWSYFKAGFLCEIKVTTTLMDVVVVCGQVCTKPEARHEMIGTNPRFGVRIPLVST